MVVQLNSKMYFSVGALYVIGETFLKLRVGLYFVMVKFILCALRLINDGGAGMSVGHVNTIHRRFEPGGGEIVRLVWFGLCRVGFGQVT